MSLSLVQSRALLGLEAAKVTVEVHLANGLPSFTLVGLADVEVKEARERVRCAIQNANLEFPTNKRITVNLAPADLPKDSGRLDLPIALGMNGDTNRNYYFNPSSVLGSLKLLVAVYPNRKYQRQPWRRPVALHVGRVLVSTFGL